MPIAVGILAALEVVSKDRLEDYLLLGELSLDGRVKAIRGALSLAMAAKENGKRGVLLPRENAEEAAVVQGIEVLGVEVLSDVVRFSERAKVHPVTSVRSAGNLPAGRGTTPMISTRSRARSM